MWTWAVNTFISNDPIEAKAIVQTSIMMAITFFLLLLATHALKSKESKKSRF